MNFETFEASMSFATEKLTYRYALMYVGFMHSFKPDDLRRQSPYAYEWRDRFASGHPTDYMDNYTLDIFRRVERTTIRLIMILMETNYV